LKLCSSSSLFRVKREGWKISPLPYILFCPRTFNQNCEVAIFVQNSPKIMRHCLQGGRSPPEQGPRDANFVPGQLGFLWSGWLDKFWIGWGSFDWNLEVLVPILRVKSELRAISLTPSLTYCKAYMIKIGMDLFSLLFLKRQVIMCFWISVSPESST